MLGLTNLCETSCEHSARMQMAPFSSFERSCAKLVVSAGDIARISMSMSFNFSPCGLVVLRTSSVTSQI